MTTVEREILSTLRELDSTVQQLRTANPKPDLMPLFERLENLTSTLPKETSPDLLHYMHKKSYEKARLFLEGRDSENARGSCDRS